MAPARGGGHGRILIKKRLILVYFRVTKKDLGTWIVVVVEKTVERGAHVRYESRKLERREAMIS